jgi:hypothetical protein
VLSPTSTLFRMLSPMAIDSSRFSLPWMRTTMQSIVVVLTVLSP